MNLKFYPDCRNAIAICIFLGFLCNTPSAIASGQLDQKPSVKMTVSVATAQAQGFPILAHITLQCNMMSPVYYWNGGPDVYPNADYFKAMITDEKGRIFTLYSRPQLTSIAIKSPSLELSNGQQQEGIGEIRKVLPGEVVDVPIAISPLPPGKYSIKFGVTTQFSQLSLNIPFWSPSLTPPLNFTVSDKPSATQQLTSALIKKTRADDHFLLDTVLRYNILPLAPQLLTNLTSADYLEADNITKALLQINTEPIGTEQAVAIAINHMNATTAIPLVYDLLRLSEKLGGTNLLRSVAHLADVGQNTRARVLAVRQLAGVKDVEVTKILIKLLSDDNIDVKRAAAVAIAKSGNPKSIPVLLELTDASNPLGDNDYEFDDDIYAALASFPGDPRVVHALNKGVQSYNSLIRQQSQNATVRLREAK